LDTSAVDYTIGLGAKIYKRDQLFSINIHFIFHSILWGPICCIMKQSLSLFKGFLRYRHSNLLYSMLMRDWRPNSNVNLSICQCNIIHYNNDNPTKIKVAYLRVILLIKITHVFTCFMAVYDIKDSVSTCKQWKNEKRICVSYFRSEKKNVFINYNTS